MTGWESPSSAVGSGKKPPVIGLGASVSGVSATGTVGTPTKFPVPQVPLELMSSLPSPVTLFIPVTQTLKAGERCLKVC